MRKTLLIGGLVLVAGIGLSSLSNASQGIECSGGASEGALGLAGYYLVTGGANRGLWKEGNSQPGLQSSARHCVDLDSGDAWDQYSADGKVLALP
ncbi:MAG: hypothetical protein HY556_06655 [Euryarchaeota archaeon]|nr:hypothetical protein [Euryarchaeota archaeon]